MLTLSSGGTDHEVFTLTLGGETIELLPLKIWTQLDHFKWTARGKLPGEPTGLEIGINHVRLAGETVALNDPAGCVKLERLFNEWLLLEKETLEQAQKKTGPQTHPARAAVVPQSESQAQRFRVEADKRGQIHIRCVQGKETVASIGLTLAGFNSLCQQGLMRKPRTLATGALHDWVELDGQLYSFEKGRDDTARLEQILNQQYLPQAAAGFGKEVVLYLNAVSSTGFDIQFPVRVAGRLENRRDHLNEGSLALLQDPERCDLLHQEIIIKLTPPNLVFKQKTPDGGEQYLPRRSENTLVLTDTEGQQKTLDLSQPLNLLRLAPAELTAIFNHPAINRHMKAALRPEVEPPANLAGPEPASENLARIPPAPGSAPALPREERSPDLDSPQSQPPAAAAPPRPVAPGEPPEPKVAEPTLTAAGLCRPLPNLWLNEILVQPELQHEWFACLGYGKMAEHFGNSNEGKFGPMDCWYITLGETEDINDPAFKGIFLTAKHSFGFLNAGQMVRFHNGVAFIGSREDALEAISVDLIGVGLDAQERLVFILSEHYRAQFGVPEITLAEVLNRLSEQGAVLLSVTEVLASQDPLEIVWTVPAEQPDPNEPQALESIRPSA